MNFFLWDNIKSLIYASQFHSEEGFIVRIVEAAATIRQQLGMFELTHQYLLRRCSLCIHC